MSRALESAAVAGSCNLRNAAKMFCVVSLAMACSSESAPQGGSAGGAGASGSSGGAVGSGGAATGGGSGGGGVAGAGAAAGSSGSGALGGAAGAGAGGTASGGAAGGGSGGVGNASGGNKRWGAGWSMDFLANTTLQNTHDTVSMRFRAGHSGLITSVRAFYMGPDRPGYGKGKPAGVELSIQGDDGSSAHMPSGVKLGTVTDKDSARLAVTQVDRLYAFSPGVQVQAGKLYHLVGKNLSADTANNFFSFDFFYISKPLRQFDGRYHPMVDNQDWAHAYRTSAGKWVLRPGYSPILDIGYDSGAHEGCGYMELGYTGLAPAQVSGAQKKIRQAISVANGTKTVVGAGVRLSKSSGTTSPLVVTLRDSSGAALDTFNIVASSFPDGKATGEDDPHWGYGTFSKAITLKQGANYKLEFSTASSGTYYARTIRKNYGKYDDATFFNEGNAEVTTNGSQWQGLHGWGGATDSDLQFFFELAP